MRSSAVASYLRVRSALCILYSLQIAFTVSRSRCVLGTVDVKFMPPFSFFLNVRLGGSLFNLNKEEDQSKEMCSIRKKSKEK